MYLGESDKLALSPAAGLDGALLSSIDRTDSEAIEWVSAYLSHQLAEVRVVEGDHSAKLRKEFLNESLRGSNNAADLFDSNAAEIGALRMRQELHVLKDYLQALCRNKHDNQTAILVLCMDLYLQDELAVHAGEMARFMMEAEACLRRRDPQDLIRPFPHYPALNTLRPECDWDDVFRPRRVCHVADTNGNYECFIKNLLGFNPPLIEESEDGIKWIGGDAVLVLTGDILGDRRGEGLKIMALLHDLRPQIEAAGGRLHVLMGNHDEAIIAPLRKWHGVVESMNYFHSRLEKKRVEGHELWSRIDPKAYDLKEFHGLLPDGFSVEEIENNPEWMDEMLVALQEDEIGKKAWQEILRMQLVHRELDSLYAHAPIGDKNAEVFSDWQMRPDAMNGVMEWALRRDLPDRVARDYFEPARLACMGLRYRTHLSSRRQNHGDKPLWWRAAQAKRMRKEGVNGLFYGHHIVSKPGKHWADANVFLQKTGMRVFGVDRGFGRVDWDDDDDKRSICEVSAFEGDIVWAL